jgi:hypothetical protein
MYSWYRFIQPVKIVIMLKTEPMKSLLSILLTFTLSFLTVSCTKSGDDGLACETNETTRVTFKNTTSVSQRVEVAKTFNAQFVPLDAVLSFDLAPGASSVKEFSDGRYFIQWKNNCSSTCAQSAFYAKEFLMCGDTEEAL